MIISNTAERLRQIMNQRGLRQVDLLNLTAPICRKYGLRLQKNDLSQYLSGKSEPGQKKLYILSQALNVTEAWLMGFDVPMEKSNETTSSDEILLSVTPHEEKVVVSYREQPSMQGAVDRILGIDDDSDAPVRVMCESDNIMRTAAFGGGTDSDDDTVKHT